MKKINGLGGAILGLALISAASVYVCSSTLASEEEVKVAKADVDTVAVKYNGGVIMASEIDEKVKEIMAAAKAQGRMPQGASEADMEKMLKDRITDELIIMKLFVAECDKKGITVTKEECEEFVKAQWQTTIADISKQVGATEDDIVKDLMSNLRIEKLLKAEIPEVAVTDEEVVAKFNELKEKHPEMFTKPEMVQASHILLKSTEADDAEKKAKIEEIYNKVVAGEDFGALAEQFSDCPSGKSSKGDLGEFPRGQMVKEFEDVAFSAKENEISKPFKTTFGWHIVKVTKKVPAEEVKLEDVKENFIQGMTQEKRVEAMQKYVEELKKAANVEVLSKTTFSEKFPIAK